MNPRTKTLLFVALAASTLLTEEALAAAPRLKMVLSADKPEHGVSCVSFVENPAIQRGWVALSGATVPEGRATALRLAANPQKQVVTGPALVPGLDILRIAEDGSPYFIQFDAETIEATALRFAEKGQHNNTNEAHSIALSGNTVYQSWIVDDSGNDKAYGLGYTPEQVPPGTWMLSAKITDADTWAKVQKGELTGFSIEAFFDTEELKLATAKVAQPARMKKPFWARLTAAKRALLGLSEVTLKDGKTVDIAEDGSVSLLDEEGNITGPAPDGEHILPDDSVLTVKDGKKVEAKPEEKEVAAADDTVTAAMEVLKGLTAESTAEEAKALLNEAVKALGATAEEKKPEEVKMAAVSLFLESVEMADGTSLMYNPITRRLTDEAGALVQTGEYACKDGSYFRVNVEQWTSQITPADYEASKTVATELAEAKVLLSRTPAGEVVKLGGDTGKETSKPQPKHLAFLEAHKA